ncbi:MAG: UDP-N-acetyl-D-galactosamine dehydrogenase [Oleiphilaceae bacterium]|jgi:UDP-N-acetyl-D-galactosamine dehydrogenase
MILSGRRINDNMSRHIAEKVLRLMTKKKIQAVNSNILVMYLTFKENCQDIRNTKMTDAIADLDSFYANIDIYDLWVNADEVKYEYGLKACYVAGFFISSNKAILEYGNH